MTMTTSKRLLLACFAVAGMACGSAASVVHQGAVAPASPASPAPYSPAPTATSSAAPTATQEPVALRPPTNPPAPPRVVTVIQNRIEWGGASVGVAGSVGNCAATTRPVPYGGAYVDSCQPGLWFDCHISVCPSWNSLGAGSKLTWWDGGGIPHTYTVTAAATIPIDGAGHSVPGGPVHFQVCTSAVGTSARVLAAA